MSKRKHMHIPQMRGREKATMSGIQRDILKGKIGNGKRSAEDKQMK
jgi:hypothetical protein